MSSAGTPDQPGSKSNLLEIKIGRKWIFAGKKSRSAGIESLIKQEIIIRWICSEDKATQTPSAPAIGCVLEACGRDLHLLLLVEVSIQYLTGAF